MVRTIDKGVIASPVEADYAFGSQGGTTGNFTLVSLITLTFASSSFLAALLARLATYLGYYSPYAYAQGVAIGDGSSHPLSASFASLASAQATFPHAIALTDELAWACHQQAINVAAAAGGGVVLTPKGTYRHDRMIKHGTKVAWRGAGVTATIIDVRSSDAGVGTSSPSDGTVRAGIEHMQFTGENGTTPIGLDLRAFTRFEGRRIMVGYFATNCVRWGGDAATYTGAGWSNLLDWCELISAPTVVLLDGVNGSAVGIPNWITLRKCTVTPTNVLGSIGVDVVQGDSLRLEDCDISYAANATGAYFRAGSGYASVHNCRFEGIGQVVGVHAVEIASGAAYHQFVGNINSTANTLPWINDADPLNNHTLIVQRHNATLFSGDNQHYEFGTNVLMRREVRGYHATTGTQAFTGQVIGEAYKRSALTAGGDHYWYDPTVDDSIIAGITRTGTGIIGPFDTTTSGVTYWRISNKTGSLAAAAVAKRGGMLRNEGATGVQDLLYIVGKAKDDAYYNFVIPQLLKGSKTHDFASIASLTYGTSTTVTVTGAALGDQARATLSIDQAGVILEAYVSAADTVTVIPFNTTGSPVDLASATLTAVAEKA